MHVSRTLLGGCIGGALASGALAGIGRTLDVTVPPWAWASLTSGWSGRTLEWARTTILLLPFVVVAAIVIAVLCAVIFEFVTRRSGWFRGLLVGLFCGTVAAALIGLIPWAAYWFGYSYVPTVRPIGASDPTWFLVAIVGAGAIVGAMTGVLSGAPRTTAYRPVFRWREIYRAS